VRISLVLASFDASAFGTSQRIREIPPVALTQLLRDLHRSRRRGMCGTLAGFLPIRDQQALYL